jgi:hypothetical protein
MIFVVKPIEVSLNQSRPFAIQVLANRLGNESITFLQMPPEKEPLLFLAALPQSSDVKLLFANQINLSPLSQTLYISKSDVFDDLSGDVKQKLIIVATGELGHHHMVAFRL